MNSLPTVDPDSATGIPGVFLLDVRERMEWDAGHAPTAVNIPMAELPGRLAEIPADRPVVCMCRSGGRSAKVVAWLSQQGYDVWNLSGGAHAWSGFGKPFVNHAGNPGTVI
jgi:rhodanese-related sulfurtransferase